MVHHFVPFVALKGPQGDKAPARVRVLAPGSAKFHSLPPGPLPPAPASAAAASTPADGQPAKAPDISVERDGDRITRIRVQCACGELIELECTY
jgi:hypothetical protein